MPNVLLHIIQIDAGVDLASILFDFARSRGRSIRILTGVGVVAQVTLQQSNGGIVILQGMFDILSFRGIMIPISTLECIGALQMTLSIITGDVIGGSVISSIVAFSPMIVTIVSFPNIAF